MTNQLWEETVCLGTWQEAKGFLNGLKDRYVFRGMSDAAYNLKTTLDRIHGCRYPGSEEILIDSFRGAVPTAIHSGPPRDDLVSWLALMRHHDLPSRLLDCTKSTLVAAYFAAQPAPDHPDCDFAIWAIDEEALQRSAEASLGILSQFSTPLSPLELGTSALFSAAFHAPRRFVALVDAAHKSPRQEAQQGLFLCPGDAGYPFCRSLHGIPPECRMPDFMYKVVLPGGVRSEVLNDLRENDIDQAHLLPALAGVEKLCTTLQERLVQSQKNRGPFEWKVAVKPILKKYGLLEAELASTERHS